MWCLEIRKRVSLFRSQKCRTTAHIKKQKAFHKRIQCFCCEENHESTPWLGSRRKQPFPEVAPHSATKLGCFSPTVVQFLWNWSSLNICQWNCWSRLSGLSFFDHITAWPITFSGNRSSSAPGHEKIRQVICKSLNIVPCHSIPFSSCSLWGGSWICWPFHHWQRRRHMNCLGCIHRQSYFKVNVMYNGQPANRIWKSNIFESTLQEQFCPGDIRSASANRLWIIYV